MADDKDIVAELRAMFPLERGDGARGYVIANEAAARIQSDAATIAALRVALEAERAAVKRVQGAFRGFQEAQKPITETYVRNSRLNSEAIATLDSERQANALLTAEVDRLTPYVEAFRREERRADDLATENDQLREAFAAVLEAIRDQDECEAFSIARQAHKE